MEGYKERIKEYLEPERLRERVGTYLESISEDRLGTRLYIFTFIAQLFTAAPARWLLGIGFGLLANLVEFLAELAGIHFLSLGISGTFVAYSAALIPLVWSPLAFKLPGEGWIWRNLVGARDASANEMVVIEAAFEVLGGPARDAANGISIYVVDSDDVFAFVRGNCLILSRGAVNSKELAAILAHELSHLESLDGRLVQSLDRFILWFGPLNPAGPPEARPHGLVFATVRWIVRWLVRIGGGAWTNEKLAPLWAPYWRNRDLCADANAVSLGVGDLLAKHLRAWELPRDCPNPRVLFNLKEHVPIAFRLDRLE